LSSGYWNGQPSEYFQILTTRKALLLAAQVQRDRRSEQYGACIAAYDLA
jgi:hypothetical protein